MTLVLSGVWPIVDDPSINRKQNNCFFIFRSPTILFDRLLK
jgi:hypothetical protein